MIRDGWPALLAMCLVVACFWSATAGGFVWDDHLLLVDNPRYRGVSAAHIEWMSSAVLAGHYHPLTWLSWGLDFSVWGMDPLGYHLTNIVLHAANAGLVYALALTLLRLLRPGTDTRAAAVGAALLFALHPLRVESVAWVTERRDVLSSFFLLVSLLAYLRTVRHGPNRRVVALIVSLVAFGASLMSKSWGVTLPAVLVVLDWYLLRRGALAVPRWSDIAWRKLPYVLVAAPFLWIAPIAQRGTGAMADWSLHPFSHRLLQATEGLAFYIHKTLLPTNLSPLYELDPFPALSQPRYWLSALFLIVLTAALVRFRNRWPAGLACWATYAIVVSPVLGFFQSGPQQVADRYSYLSCIPLALVCGGGFAWLMARGGRVRTGAAAGLLVLVVALAALTARQIPVWRDRIVLWEHTVALQPESIMAHKVLSIAYRDARRYDEAKTHWQIFLRLRQEVHERRQRGR